MADETEMFMKAIDDLDAALDESIEMTRRMKERIEELRAARAAGRSLKETVPEERRPLLVQLLTESGNLLHSYGTRVRRTEARALYREGLTMDEIADLFGVSRQRVSVLLREKGD